MGAPKELWAHEFRGRQVHSVRVATSRVAVCYSETDDRPPTIVGFDLDGKKAWRRTGASLHLALPGDRFVIVSADGLPQIIDAQGAWVSSLSDEAFRCSDASYAVRIEDELVFHSREEIVVTNLELRVLRRLRVSSKAMGSLIGDAYFWFEGNELWRCDVGGRPARFCEAFAEVVSDARKRWKREMGMPGTASRLGPNGTVLGREPIDLEPQFGWWLLGDPRRGQLLVRSGMPHVVGAIGLDAEIRWTSYLSRACCGGTPVPLDEVGYVVGLGCGGNLAWLDAEGQKTLETGEPSPAVQVLRDGRVISISDNLICYDTGGSELWRLNEYWTSFDCNKDGTRFVAIVRRGPMDAPNPVLVKCFEAPRFPLRLAVV